MAKLGGRMGPFYSARAAVDAAAQAGRRLGLREDGLLKYMTRQRKIRSGPLTGTDGGGRDRTGCAVLA